MAPEHIARGRSGLSVLILLICLPVSAPAQSAASRLEGMWSDPPVTPEGLFCFFACTDAGIARLNALLDNPANDARPFPELQAEAKRFEKESLRSRLTPAALQRYPLDPADDPGFLRCEPWGVARQIFAPHQLEIRQRGTDRMELRYGEWDGRRTVYLDGRPSPAAQAPSAMGQSVGRWDGETWVVETSRIAANIIMLPDLSMMGEHSDQLRVVERYTRSTDGDTLLLTATLTDPRSFREPLVLKKIWRWAPEQQIMDVTDEAGKVGSWVVEFAGRLNLSEFGWTAGSIKAGERVTVTGNPTHTGSQRMFFRGLVRADGTELLPGAAQRLNTIEEERRQRARQRNPQP